jgi:hypothetical protein
MFRVVKAGLEVQYGNFFNELQGAVGLSRHHKASNQEPATLTGLSGVR